MLLQLFFMLDILARAGGGGSGGGGGGGGGSSGGGIEGLALIGYFPSYYAGKLVKKLLPRKAELIVSIVSASIMTVVLLVIGVLMNGGFLLMVFIAIGVWAGWYAAFFGVWDKIKQRAQKTTEVINASAQLDSAWNIDSLKEHARNTFLTYQQDWSTFNLQNIMTYTTKRYAQHAGLMLRTLKELHRTNTLSNVTITGLEVISAHDSTNNDEDSYQVAIEASALDTLTDTLSGETLFSDTSKFIEYWTFVRSGDAWLLERIDQSTASAYSADTSIAQFAAANQMYYSLDMGWLFLPRRGVLFSGGKFGTSDINNHTVGVYNQNLVQLYTYCPAGARARGNDRSATYDIIVAQINLPKSYGGILVRRKTGFFSAWKPPKAPRDYQEYRLEWPDFHTRYSVHATNQDSLATFELLNPGFMAFLYDTDSNVSIEVADNVVYLYKAVTSRGVAANKTAHYNVFMEILNRAFKELRL